MWQNIGLCFLDQTKVQLNLGFLVHATLGICPTGLDLEKCAILQLQLLGFELTTL